MHKKSVAKFFVVVLAAILVFSACRVAENKEEFIQNRQVKAAGTDEFVFGFDIEPPSLDPQANIYLNGMTIQNMIFDTLVVPGEKDNYLPALAEKWEYSGVNTIRFKLREDVYFHNGDQLTAEDVKFSISRMASEPNSKEFFESFDAENTTVISKYVIDVKFKSPTGNALTLLCSARGAIVPQNYFNKVGAENFGLNPVGTGAFKFVEWQRGSQLTLVRNEHYFGELPNYKYFKAKFILDGIERKVALQNAEIDASVCIYMDEVYELAEQNDDDNYLKIFELSYRYYTLIFKTEGLFEDVELRKAFTHAIDIEKLAQEEIGEQGIIMDTPMPSGLFSAQTQGVYQFDYSRAKRMLKEQGYSMQDTFTLTVMEGITMEKIAGSLKNLWYDVGVDVELEVLDQVTFEERIKNGDFEMYLYTAMPSTGDPAQVFEHLLDENGAITGKNYEVLSKTLTKAKEELNTEKRKEYYREVQEYLHKNYLEIPLISDFNNIVTRLYVLGIESSPNFILDFRKVKINYETT